MRTITRAYIVKKTKCLFLLRTLRVLVLIEWWVPCSKTYLTLGEINSLSLERVGPWSIVQGILKWSASLVYSLIICDSFETTRFNESFSTVFVSLFGDISPFEFFCDTLGVCTIKLHFIPVLHMWNCWARAYFKNFKDICVIMNYSKVFSIV